MFCMKCGNEIKNGERFCCNCGAEQNIIPNLVQQEGIYQIQQQQQYNLSTLVVHNGKVSFGKAITLYFKNYVNFKGRASKSEYWWLFLFSMIINILSYIITYNLPILGSALSSLITIAFLLPSLSLSIRRLHDTGKSWVYMFMGLIPIAGPIIMLITYLKDSDGDNQWGPGPIAPVYDVNSFRNSDVQSQRIITDKDICQSVEIVKKMFQKKDEKMSRKVFYGGYQEAHEIIISIYRILQKGINCELEEGLLLSDEIYTQVWIRKRGFSPELCETKNIKNNLKNRFIFVDEQILEDAIDMCVQIIYINEPDIKERDSAAEFLKSMHLKNASMNKTIEFLYVDDIEYGLVPNKPVFVAGFGNNRAFLDSLCTDTGEEIVYQRIGSNEVKGIEGPVDSYNICKKNGEKYGVIYLCVYGSAKPTRVPKGYMFKK